MARSDLAGARATSLLGHGGEGPETQPIHTDVPPSTGLAGAAAFGSGTHADVLQNLGGAESGFLDALKVPLASALSLSTCPPLARAASCPCLG